MPAAAADFLALLQSWLPFARQYWWDDAERPDLGYFGTGYNSWGVQTNQKFVGAMAVLGASGEDEALTLALRALRYSLASHVSGDHHCSDGTQWGHTWISALGVERMLHGVSAMQEHLTDADRAGLRGMLCSEADWLLDFQITGTLWAADGGNRPESNIWNGAIMTRAARLYPDEPHAGDWMEQAQRFLINGISIPADAEDDTIVGGKPVRERHIGPNFFPHYALDHHGYLNVGYMVICLSNIAMLHYGLLMESLTPPESLYWHARELWGLVRQLVFDDGRLLRMGGDSRHRYCYCQDYLLPTLRFCADVFADERAADLEARALDLIRAEHTLNADGSFLSQRLRHLRETNPYYYARLESDKAAVLSMNAAWSGLDRAGGVTFADAAPAAWHEPRHGALFVRSPRRFASWSWRAWDAPQGMCLPPDDGHLAEWCENLAGSVRVAGATGKRVLVRHEEQPFHGGFVTTGETNDACKAVFGEGWTYPAPVRHQLAVAALPDDRTMIVLQHCAVSIRTYLTEVKGLRLSVPNDLFNGFTREIASASGTVCSDGRERGVSGLGGRWANVAGRLGVVSVYGSDEVSLFQAGERRASPGPLQSLYVDELCAPCRVGLWDVPAGTAVLDCGNVVLAGADAAETAAVCAGVETRAVEAPLVRAAVVPGANGRRYLFLANFGPSAADFCMPREPVSAIIDVVTREDAWNDGSALWLSIPAGGAQLLELIQ